MTRQHIQHPIQQFEQAVTPTDLPVVGAHKMYPKSDGEWYKLDELGNETPFGGGGDEHEEFLPLDGEDVVDLAYVPLRITMVARGGVVQSADDGHYTMGGQSITFAEPFDGTERVVVEYALQRQNPAPPYNGGSIIDGTIDNSKLAGLPWIGSAPSGVETDITTASLGTLDYADESVTNIKQGVDTQRPNLLQNGGFELWPYGSGPFTTLGAVTAAGWLLNMGGSSLSVSQDTVNVDAGSSVAAAVDCIHVDYGLLYQKVESFTQLRGRTLTFSVRVRTATPNAVRARLDDNVAAQFGAFHPGDDAWHTLSVSMTYAATATAVQAHIQFDASCTAYIDNAMLVIGEVATDYMPSISYPDSIPNSRLGASVARANLLTNGGFEVWQRGPGPFTSGGAGNSSADRWFTNISDVLTTWSISRVAGISSQYGAGVTFALNGGVFMQIIQNLVLADGGIAAELAGHTVSFSVDVVSDQPNGVRIGIQYIGGYIYSAFHPGGGVAQRLQISLAIPIGQQSVQGFIEFAGDCTATLDDAMLVLGEVPADYAPLHPADELARCQRYYEVIGGGSTGAMAVSGFADVASRPMYIPIQYVEKAVVPTLTKAGTWGVYNCGQPSLNGPDRDVCQLAINATAGPDMFNTFNTGVGSCVIAEANP